MEVTIYDAAGNGHLLPALLRWDIAYGFCSPCDSISLAFLYAPEMLEPLKNACRISAVHGGSTVFTGVIDEVELSAESGGCTAVIEGRGMQALLLDSEAESADYVQADLDFILRRHVNPYGISAEGAAPGKTASLSVSAGESHWSVFSRYAEFCLGMRPRFRPDGVLIPDGGDSGNRFRLDGNTAVLRQRFTQQRYGVLSEVLVKNRVYGTTVKVENAGFQAIGGCAGRVVSVPRYTGFDAMRHTGEYQLRKSAAEFQSCLIALPECFAAFPGDRVSMTQSPLGITGDFIVEAARSRADGTSAGTELELRPAEA